MNFQTITYFLVLSREKNFTRAAEKLHITQQTLSANISALEREWGTKFFLRHVPLELTEEGKVFYRYALRFARDEESLRRMLSDMENEEAGTLRIGMGFARERKLMPRLAAGFRRKFPKVSFYFRESSNEGLMRLVREGELDLAIGRFEKDPPGLSVRPLYKEHIALLAAESLLDDCGLSEEDRQKLSASHLEDLHALAHCPFLLTSTHNVAGAVGARYLSRAPFEPQVAAFSDNMITLVDMAFQGMGAVFCPANLIGEIPADRPMVRIDLPETEYAISFAWRLGSPPWSIREAFMEYVAGKIGKQA